MRVLLRGVFLTGLLVPPAAHGQKRIVLPSIGPGLGYSLRLGEPQSYWVGKYNVDFTVAIQLSIFNPEGKLGFHRVTLFTNSPEVSSLVYGRGIASSGRYHFASFSVGPALVSNDGGLVVKYVPEGSSGRGAEYDTTRAGISLGVHGQARALFMPLKFLGLGISLDGFLPLRFGAAYKHSVQGYRKRQGGFSFILIVRTN